MPYGNDRAQQPHRTEDDAKRKQPTQMTLSQTGSANVLPSSGELERSVSQALQKAYRQYLGHLPSRVSCHLFANKLSVWVENSLTPVENILLASSAFSADEARSSDPNGAQSNESIERSIEKGLIASDEAGQSAKELSSSLSNGQYLQEVRVAIDRAMRQRLSQVIEDCLNVGVTTIISGTCYEQRCTSLSVLLTHTPAVRNPERIPKTVASRQFNRKPTPKAEAAS